MLEPLSRGFSIHPHGIWVYNTGYFSVLTRFFPNVPRSACCIVEDAQDLRCIVSSAEPQPPGSSVCPASSGRLSTWWLPLQYASGQRPNPPRPSSCIYGIEARLITAIALVDTTGVARSSSCIDPHPSGRYCSHLFIGDAFAIGTRLRANRMQKSIAGYIVWMFHLPHLEDF